MKFSSSLPNTLRRPSQPSVPVQKLDLLHQIRQINSKSSSLFSAPDLHPTTKPDLLPFSSPPLSKKKSTQPLKADSIFNYSIGKTIGSGSFATVKKAIHKRSRSLFAIKFYAKKSPTISQEVKILKALAHPNIVQLKSAFNSMKTDCLVLEYVPGVTLNQYVKADKCVKETEIKDVFKQLVEAVEYMHSSNIAHRDIKLENIIVTHSGHIKLVDFGLAVFEGTQTSKLCGTPKYMAPELITDTLLHFAPADIWALGNVLYFLFTQKLPFYGYGEAELNTKIANGEYIPPLCLSAEVQELIQHMLDVDPTRRWTARQILSSPWLL